MYSRRKLLVGICLSTALAGCSGSQPSGDSGTSDDQSNTTSDGSGSDDSGDSLPETTITIENMSYGFGGLTTRLTLQKETTDKLRIFVATKAYNNDELIGEASQYVTFTRAEDIKLEIESISEMADNVIDDVTEFVIEARPTGGKTYKLRTFSAEELNEKIESTDN